MSKNKAEVMPITNLMINFFNRSFSSQYQSLRIMAANDQPFPHARSEAEGVRAANAARQECHQVI
jgi:hypothetical protein